MDAKSRSIPNAPQPVPGELVDAAHPTPNAQGTNATQHVPDPRAEPMAGIGNTPVKPRPYPTGNV